MKVCSVSKSSRPITICTMEIKFLCDETTPLEGPVVPDEYNRVAVSSWLTRSLTRFVEGGSFFIIMVSSCCSMRMMGRVGEAVFSLGRS